jgi:hypothetical protein
MHGIKRLRHVAYLKNIIAARHWTPPANDPVELIDFRLIETTRQAELGQAATIARDLDPAG